MTTATRAATGPDQEQVDARERIYAAPLESLDPGNPARFPTGEWQYVFERLRAEDPVHFTADEHTEFDRYWSLTRWADIQAADTNHEAFSADGLITLNRPQTAAAGVVDLQRRHDDPGGDARSARRRGSARCSAWTRPTTRSTAAP